MSAGTYNPPVIKQGDDYDPIGVEFQQQDDSGAWLPVTFPDDAGVAAQLRDGRGRLLHQFDVQRDGSVFTLAGIPAAATAALPLAQVITFEMEITAAGITKTRLSGRTGVERDNAHG